MCYKNILSFYMLQRINTFSNSGKLNYINVIQSFIDFFCSLSLVKY